MAIAVRGSGDSAFAGQTAVRAQSQNRAIDLAFLPIEDLMNIEITSASQKEQRFGDIPAAVYVITAEDIRRSGLTTVPELFRLVPGMQVAQINSNKWAVAVRGFNGLFGGKLLVLIDGRSMYDRLNSGASTSISTVAVVISGKSTYQGRTSIASSLASHHRSYPFGSCRRASARCARSRRALSAATRRTRRSNASR
jgi:outer membrane receptor protein involved in Fe transport